MQPAKKPHKEAPLTLLLANVKMDNRNSPRLRQIIAEAEPDVILVVEADAWWQSELSGLGQTHPFTVRQAQDNTYGMLLYSKLELLRPEVRFLIEKDVPSIRAVVKLPAGTEVEIHCLHPRPPVPQETAQSTERDAELMVVGKETKGREVPIVVMGDLNDVAWSRTNYLFQKISRLLDRVLGVGSITRFTPATFFCAFRSIIFFIRITSDSSNSSAWRTLDRTTSPCILV